MNSRKLIIAVLLLAVTALSLPEAISALAFVFGAIHTYPTMSEANKFAAGEWKRK